MGFGFTDLIIALFYGKIAIINKKYFSTQGQIMIDWKRPEPADLKRIYENASREQSMGSDMSYVNIFLLADKYDLHIAFEEDLLTRRYKTRETNLGRNGYTFPTGCSLSETKRINKVLEMLEKEAGVAGVPLSFCLLTEYQKIYLEKRYPDMEFISYPGDSDYLYTAEHLGKLPGRSNHKKKNHVSKFIREYPDFEFKIYDKDNSGECSSDFKLCDIYRVEEAWIKEREDFLEHSQALERSEIKTAVKLFRGLELSAAVIRVDGKPVAMSVASEISPGIFDIHFEKSYGEYATNGAYAAINKLFSEYLLEKKGARWINREEDIGIEGLRKAKESYHPDMMLHKYSGFLRKE